MPRIRLFFIVHDRRATRAGRDRDMVETEIPTRLQSSEFRRNERRRKRENASAAKAASCIIVRKFLSQRTVMPYSETPPKPDKILSSSSLGDFVDIFDRLSARLAVCAGPFVRQAARFSSRPCRRRRSLRSKDNAPAYNLPDPSRRPERFSRYTAKRTGVSR